MNDLIQIQVEQAGRSANGWICDVAEYGLPDCTERFVHEDEVLAFLGAEKGLIEVNVDDERTELITLDEWAADNAGLELESVLSVIINRRELRTIYKPLNQELTALQPISKLKNVAA